MRRRDSYRRTPCGPRTSEARRLAVRPSVDTRPAQAHNRGKRGSLPANHLALSLTYWITTLLDATVAHVENQRQASELPRRAGTL